MVKSTQTPSQRWHDAVTLVERIECSIGEALSLLSGGRYQGENLDYWQNVYRTRDEEREAREESEFRHYVATHRL